MEIVIFPVFILAFGALIIGLIIVSKRMEARRREALGALAVSLGLEFSPEDDESLRARLSMFPLFSRGHGRRLTNTLRGVGQGVEFEVFDYRFTTGSGKSSSTWNTTVVHFRVTAVRFPEFTLRPENFFDRIGQALGMKDIDFEGHTEFSKRYLLRGDDEEAIGRLFNERVLGLFERDLGGDQALSVEGSGPDLIIYRLGKRLKPEQFREFFHGAQGVFAELIAAAHAL